MAGTVEQKVAEDSADAHAIHDRAKIGPGQWVYLHFKAARTQTRPEFLQFRETLEDVITHFSCEECAEHAQAYVRDHPIEPYFRDVDTDGTTGRGASRYMWEFHNAVNERIGKPIMTWDEAKRLYYGSSCASCRVVPETMPPARAAVPTTRREPGLSQREVVPTPRPRPTSPVRRPAVSTYASPPLWAAGGYGSVFPPMSVASRPTPARFR